MHPRLATVLHWTPRVIAIAFAIFLSVFALDVFNEGYRGGRMLLALVMHLLPTTGVVVASLLLAWQWPSVGAALFAAAGILYIATAGAHSDSKLLIGGPLFLTAALYLADALVRRRRHA